MNKPAEPKLTHITDLTVELAAPIEMGQGRGGHRRIIPIIGGRAHGPKLTGRILNLGADWQTVFDDGLAELDTRYGIETDDGATIEIINYGFRHGPADVMRDLGAGKDVAPDAYYMRTQARLETGDARYNWVNRTLFIGSGARFPNQVMMSLYAIE